MKSRLNSVRHGQSGNSIYFRALKTARQVMGSPIISTDKEGGPSIFKRHMKTRSSRVNNAFKTRGIRREYEGNTRLKHVEYEGNTGLKRSV
jgi:hypothetical protein